MQGARAQQGVHLASAGNATDGPQAGQPEGKALAGAPLVVAFLACARLLASQATKQTPHAGASAEGEMNDDTP
jgi:hypothetical protein